MQNSVSQSIVDRDILLVGGGHSHIEVIRRFGMQAPAGVHMTLVCDTVHTPYSGMLPGLIAGHYQFDDCHIDLRKLCQSAGVRLIVDSAVGLSPQERTLHCASQPSLRFDVLSINCGSRPALHLVQDAQANGHPVKPVGPFLNAWHTWLAQHDHTAPNHIAVVGGGAAGVEVLMAMQHSLPPQSRSNTRFSLISQTETVPSGHNKRVQRHIMRALQRQQVALHLGTTVVASDPQGVQLANGTHIAADFIAWALPAAAPAWLANSGLPVDANGFVLVDQQLRCHQQQAIFAVGDSAAFMPQPLAKAGVYAVREAAVLYHNLIATALQQPLQTFKPQSQFLSLLTLGKQYAVASRGWWFAKGAWVWRWKNRIDRQFMARYQPLALPPSTADTTPNPMRCGGCGAKIGAQTLHSVLQQLTLQPCPDSQVKPGDDAAVISLPADRQLVQSVDFFRTFIDDPYTLGQICANHCLGDIYAMGASPHSAQVSAVIPLASEDIMHDTLLQLMRGVLATLQAAGAHLLGGHSAEGKELAVGLVVNGLLTPGQALTKAGMQPGQTLLLSKPLGTGVLLAANMHLACEGRWLQQALQTMQQSNQQAAAILRHHQASAATDITGFGLLGHLQEMCAASGCSASLRWPDIPLLPGAMHCAEQGYQSSLAPANRAVLQAVPQQLSKAVQTLLTDPQTAGGLLATVPASHSAACLQQLQLAGYEAAIIGQAVQSSEGHISITLG